MNTAVAYVLTTLVIFASGLMSQKGPINYGEQWSDWPDSTRSAYVAGFIDGQSATYFKMMNDVPVERRDPLRLKTFTMYTRDSIRTAMTELYSNPANTFIRFDSMVYIARDKLDGLDVKPILRLAREMDRAYTVAP